MKILILGAGQVGRTAAQHLSREEANEVTVVDHNEDALRELQERLEVRTVVGNAAHPAVLEAAGAGEADVMVALTSSDEVNMMACEVAFTLFRTPTKIARIRAAEYTDRAALFGAVRGGDAADVKSLSACLYALADFAWHNADCIAEIDLNPIKVLPQRRGCIVVDALIVARPDVAT